jgi:epoxyqueuosine reductase
MKLHSETIKQTARKQGFALCGIAKAEPLIIEKERFKNALEQNFHAHKPYLERDIDKRFAPELLLENCKSVVVCGFNYNMEESRIQKAESKEPYNLQEIPRYARNDRHEYKISKYVQIKDYHIFMKQKLEKLAQELQKIYGIFSYKTTADSSLISEKALAVKAGIGYYGKNGIIQTSLGSFVFLGTLIIDKEVDTYDSPNLNNCGNCNKCITACPTQAIVAPYYVDCNQCITNIVQNTNEADFTRMAKYGWLIACDECQNVCPNNAHATINEEAVSLRALFVDNQEEILENLTPESFEKYFTDTPFYKFKYEGLKKRLKEIGFTENQITSSSKKIKPNAKGY